jgi:glycosyltransferase involved in cell wall biosynthesis
LIESLQTLASLGPVFLSVAPYLAAFRTQHKDEAFLQETAERFPAANALRSKGEGRAWITDTFSDFNGVARTVRSLGEAALRDGKQLTIVTCDSAATPTDGIRLKNFTPLGEFEMPEYRTQRLSMPPLLEMIEYLERERFNELIISTPGPLGLCALLAARLLGLKTSGIYHTDFPRYVRCHTHDEALERVTSWFMNWFYNQVDRVYVPSESYRKQLTSLGVEAGRIRLFGHGVDTNLFNPSRKQAGWWKARGLGDGFNYLYVGRISREKNLGLLLDTFAEVRKRMPDANLLIVGDGPLREKLESRGDAGVAFTGWLDGEELATAFAGGDVLVFPSTTDTFGNVVLEAHACGLPAIVSHRGGPREIVARHGSGLIVNVDHPFALREAMLAMPNRTDLAELRDKSLQTAQESRWESVLDALWKGESFPQGIAETDIVEADSEIDEEVLLALDFA